MQRELSNSEYDRIEELCSTSSKLESIVDDVIAADGQIFLVGGAVRDMLLQEDLKDLDIEVHGVSLDDLKTILEKHGIVNYVGKSFGVLKFKDRDAQDTPEIDFSLPRTDSSGRKPEVEIDPTMGLRKALQRRDLTVNAMAIDLATHELHDPFSGSDDLDAGVLRCPDKEFFVEDPLRFFRVMQFIGRFGLYPDKQLQQLCEQMDISTVSVERIEQEFNKLLLKSDEPSYGIRWLHALGRLQEILPELAATVGCIQSSRWHPEGDVFEHTMQVVDAAAQVDCSFDQNKLVLMYAALCHDLGKPITTKVDEDGKVTSYMHEEKGVPLAKAMLGRICGHKKLIATVAKLVRWHMCPGNFVKEGAKTPAYRRLALKLAPETNMQMLAWLSEADKRGRNGDSSVPLPRGVKEVDEFAKKAKKIGVLTAPEVAVLTGEDLLDVVEPGPKLGELVKKAYEIQINEGITDKDALRKRVL